MYCTGAGQKKCRILVRNCVRHLIDLRGIFIGFVLRFADSLMYVLSLLLSTDCMRQSSCLHDYLCTVSAVLAVSLRCMIAIIMYVFLLLFLFVWLPLDVGVICSRSSFGWRSDIFRVGLSNLKIRF